MGRGRCAGLRPGGSIAARFDRPGGGVRRGWISGPARAWRLPRYCQTPTASFWVALIVRRRSRRVGLISFMSLGPTEQRISLEVFCEVGFFCIARKIPVALLERDFTFSKSLMIFCLSSSSITFL